MVVVVDMVMPSRRTPRTTTLPLDLLRHEVLVRGTPVPDPTLTEIVDQIVLPLLARRPTR